MDFKGGPLIYLFFYLTQSINRKCEKYQFIMIHFVLVNDKVTILFGTKGTTGWYMKIEMVKNWSLCMNVYFFSQHTDTQSFLTWFSSMSERMNSHRMNTPVLPAPVSQWTTTGCVGELPSICFTADQIEWISSRNSRENWNRKSNLHKKPINFAINIPILYKESPK